MSILIFLVRPLRWKEIITDMEICAFDYVVLSSFRKVPSGLIVAYQEQQKDVV